MGALRGWVLLVVCIGLVWGDWPCQSNEKAAGSGWAPDICDYSAIIQLDGAPDCTAVITEDYTTPYTVVNEERSRWLRCSRDELEGYSYSQAGGGGSIRLTGTSSVYAWLATSPRDSRSYFTLSYTVKYWAFNDGDVVKAEWCYGSDASYMHRVGAVFVLPSGATYVGATGGTATHSNGRVTFEEVTLEPQSYAYFIVEYKLDSGSCIVGSRTIHCTDAPQGEDLTGGEIAGIIIGVIAFIAIVVAVVVVACCCIPACLLYTTCRKWFKKDKEEEKKEGSGDTVPDTDCRICMEQPMDTMLLPCHHLVVCHNCAAVINTCPVCRATVTGRDQAIVC